MTSVLPRCSAPLRHLCTLLSRQLSTSSGRPAASTATITPSSSATSTSVVADATASDVPEKPVVLPGAADRPILWNVPPTEEGARLDRFVKRRAPGVPPGLIQRLIRQRRVMVNGKAAIQNAHAVQDGDTIAFPGWVKLGLSRGKRAPPKDDAILAEVDIVRSWILHRDARTTVINKPPGLPVTATPGVRDLHALLPALGSGKYWLVHRLDAPASGALVLARDVGAAGLLSEAFRARQVSRTYWALVAGHVHEKSGTIQAEVDGKRATTHFRVIRDIAKKFSWLELTPSTGRKHQLRVHCAHELGCPIVGDDKYGPQGFAAKLDVPQQALLPGAGLHLICRRIQYPKLTDVVPRARTKKRTGFVDVEAPLPPHMADSWRRFGLEESMANV